MSGRGNAEMIVPVSLGLIRAACETICLALEYMDSGMACETDRRLSVLWVLFKATDSAEAVEIIESFRSRIAERRWELEQARLHPGQAHPAP